MSLILRLFYKRLARYSVYKSFSDATIRSLRDEHRARDIKLPESYKTPRIYLSSRLVADWYPLFPRRRFSTAARRLREKLGDMHCSSSDS